MKFRRTSLVGAGVGSAILLMASAYAASSEGDGEPATRDSPIPPRGRVERPTQQNPLWAIPLRALPVTGERPIFLPSRRAPAPVVAAPPPRVEPPKQAAAPPPTPPPRLTLSLVGTVVGDSDDSGIAVFLDRSTQQLIRLKNGEGHAGWILRSLRSREVVLENGTQSQTLTLAPADAPATQRQDNL